jgi:hypothetical protein
MPRWDKWRKHRKCHAKVRAEERYEIHLTNQDLVNIVGMIKNRKYIASHRISNSKSVKLVEYREQKLVVLYSHRHQEVITFLPRENSHAKRLEAAVCD